MEINSMKFVNDFPHTQVPDKIYNYISNVEYATKAINNKGIYLSPTDKFNDPFDETWVPYHLGSKTYKITSTVEEICRFYLTNRTYIEKYWGNIDFVETCKSISKLNLEWTIDLEEAIKIFIEHSKFDKIPATEIFNDILKKRMAIKKNIKDDNIKICCFSERRDSIPMWAYYAKSHTGVCLEYDTTLLEDKDILNAIAPINYENKRNTEYVHFNKSIEWKHEKEWRIAVRDYKDEYLPFDCLSAIYLGVNFNFNDIDQERNAWLNYKNISQYNYSKYIKLIDALKSINHNVDVYMTTADLEEYTLNFNLIFSTKP